MTDMEIMDKIFGMYRFDRSIPDSVRSKALSAEKDVLIAVLKSIGKYTFMTAIIIHLVFFLNKFGIGMSIIKAYFTIKVVTIVAASAAIVTTGSIILSHNTGKKQLDTFKSQPPVDTVTYPESKSDKPVTAITYKYELIPLTSTIELKREADSFNQKLLKSIVLRLGNTGATLIQNSDSIRSPYVIGGSFSRLGDTYHISISIIDSGKSLTKTIINKTCTAEEIDTVVMDISKSIAQLDL